MFRRFFSTTKIKHTFGKEPALRSSFQEWKNNGGYEKASIAGGMLAGGGWAVSDQGPNFTAAAIGTAFGGLGGVFVSLFHPVIGFPIMVCMFEGLKEIRHAQKNPPEEKDKS